MREFSETTLAERALAANNGAMHDFKMCKFLSNTTRFIRVTRAQFARKRQSGMSGTLQQYKEPRKKHHPLQNQHSTMFVDACKGCVDSWRGVLNTRILSVPDRSRHQAAPRSSLPLSSSLHGILLYQPILAAPVASCRLMWWVFKTRLALGRQRSTALRTA